MGWRLRKRKKNTRRVMNTIALPKTKTMMNNMTVSMMMEKEKKRKNNKDRNRNRISPKPFNRKS